ncbi:MAG: site-specific DNA-methyltransferase [Clostridia bacterium]
MGNKLELTWVGKYENEEIEPRILIEDKEKSYGDKNTGNMLIHGDNLLALKALEREYSGKIKCIYIDPPFNTGAAFEHYDDNLEHSIWLNLMRKRLMILRNLLADNGVILVHLDDEELHYLKIIMDETFGRNKFVSSITVQSSTPSGTKLAHKNKTILKTKDTILVYKKTDNLEIEPQYMALNQLTNFNSFFEVIDDDKEIYNIKSLKEVLVEKEIINSKDRITDIKLDSNPKFEEFCLKYRNNIFRRQPSMPEDIKKFSKQNPDKIIKYIHNGEKFYAQNGYRFAFLDGSIKEVEGKEMVAQLVCDLWTDISFHGTQYEGNNSFPAGKKPERLIMRVLKMFTKEGDFVLDSFLGSGTTAAVANKMKRKWIGIEMGEQCYTHCKKRIDWIIDGNDKNAVSTLNDYNGGGGYKFFELAPTLINKDLFGEAIINKEYNADMLASAVALHEGFKYNPSKEKFWKQSEGNEKSYLYVTTKFLNKEDIENIKTDMEDNEFLIIACTAYDKDIEGLYKNIKIKKIPEMLLAKCEFGKENYNLNIINPPEYEEEIEDDE